MKPYFTRHNFFTRYLISNNGLVWDSLKDREVVHSLNNSGYKHVTLYSDNGKRYWVPIHKLVAETFVVRPNHYSKFEKLTVNHKNGLKDDNRSENLEWCTMQENKRHAGANGLTLKFLPVEIKLVATDETMVFDSFVDCASYLGISKDSVSWRVKSGPKMVHDGYQFRRFHGTFELPWPEPAGKDVVVRDLLTNSTQIFNTSREVAKHTGASEVTVWNWLRRDGQPVLNNRFQLQWAYGCKPWRDPSKEEIEFGRKRKVKPVKVTDPLTGDVKLFASGTECARAMGLTKTNLLHRLKYASNKVHSDGYMYSYHSHSKE